MPPAKAQGSTSPRGPGSRAGDPRTQAVRAGLRVAGIFLVFGGLWILLSDRALALLVPDPAALTRFQTYKGWAFVLATALILYVLVRGEVRRRLAEEERFLRLADNAPDVIYRYRLHPEPGFEYVSPAVTAITGYTPEDHYRDPYLPRRLVHPDDAHLVQEAEDGALDDREPVLLRWVRKDGGVRWVEHHHVLVRDAEGRSVAVEGIARDVTDRLDTEAALQARAAWERSLLESSPVAIFALDRSRTMLSWNAAAERIFGWSAEEVVGRTLPIVPPGRTEESLALVERIWAGETVRQVELERRTKDGSTVRVRLSAAPIRSAAGETTGIIATMEDVTEHRAAERALAQERALQQQIMEHTPVGITVLDVEGTIVFANPSAERLLGLSRSEMAGRRYNAPSWQITALDGSPFPDADLPFARVLRTGEPVADVRHAVTVPGGRRVLLSVNAAPLPGEDGGMAGVVTILEDITGLIAEQEEREQVEIQLRQAQKLEAVGRLAGGIAHDFNNMLSVIMSAADLARREVAAESEVYRDLCQIREAAERSADLTRQLLAFSRKQVIQPEVLDLNRVVRQQERILKRLIGEEVQIRLELMEGLWDVFMDPSQVDQILANLLVNARDAIGGQGTVTIVTDNAELDASQAREGLPIRAGEYVRLSVTDDGAGMSPEVMEHIFEPFFTTKPVGEGTGMGLATVYGIVKQSGGVIHVESEPGRGAAFHLYLPRHQGAPAPAEPERGDEPLRGSETVLVVEDEAAVLDLARRFLERCGYRVLTAGTPEHALRVAGHHKGVIELLLTDVVLPGMNGRELETAILELRPEIRTLFMSGYAPGFIAQRGVLDDGVSFLQKPFTLRDLARKVRQVLDAG